jgi:hypothetical protein
LNELLHLINPSHLTENLTAASWPVILTARGGDYQEEGIRKTLVSNDWMESLPLAAERLSISLVYPLRVRRKKER